jgi:hypothetical protein
MANMTEEEADALDELWTKTTPKIKKGEGGFFTERRARILLLDEATAHILNARALATRQSPAQIVSELVHKEIAAVL